MMSAKNENKSVEHDIDYACESSESLRQIPSNETVNLSSEESESSTEERDERLKSSYAKGDGKRQRRRYQRQANHQNNCSDSGSSCCEVFFTCKQCTGIINVVSRGTQVENEEIIRKLNFQNTSSAVDDKVTGEDDSGKKSINDKEQTEPGSTATQEINSRVCLVEEEEPDPILADADRLSLSSSSSSSFTSGSNDAAVAKKSFLPTIGPPKIVTYVGELPMPGAPRLDLSDGIGDNTLHQDSCQFCGDAIILPDTSIFANQEYCCEKYRVFVETCAEHQTTQHGFVEDELIDIAPHPPHGTKAARKAAKERAAERLREREMEKQKAAVAHSNFYSFSRQMKTIQFSLSSSKCMAEGWTIRPPSPVVEPIRDRGDSFIVDFNASQIQQRKELNEKFYDSGQRFLTIFADGTGCCYYPSGDIAVAITSTEEGRFTYIVQENSNCDTSDHSGLLALFEANGKACCYFPDGALRMCLNSYGGIELDERGRRKKRWRWHFIKGHVHAPPFQSTVMVLNKNLSVRVREQDNIALTFSCAKKTVKFNVGAKLKALKPNKRNDLIMEAEETYLQETKKVISLLTSKINLMLRFPKSMVSDGRTTSKTPLELTEENRNTVESAGQRTVVLIS